LRYFWVHCLCIVPDDIRDWHRETSAMVAVYENAFITTAAAWGYGQHWAAGLVGHHSAPRGVRDGLDLSGGDLG